MAESICNVEKRAAVVSDLDRLLMLMLAGDGSAGFRGDGVGAFIAMGGGG